MVRGSNPFRPTIFLQKLLDRSIRSGTLDNMNTADAINFLRDNGYAVVYFEPSELRGADPRKVEESLNEFAYGVIDFHSDKN